MDDAQAAPIELLANDMRRHEMAFIGIRIGRIAHADEIAFFREQAAAAASADGGAGNLNIMERDRVAGRRSDTVEREYPAFPDGRIRPGIAADAQDRHPGHDRLLFADERGDPDRTRRGNDDETEVGFQVVMKALTERLIFRAVAEKVNFDRAFALRFAKDVAAGQDEGLPAFRVDDRPRSPGMAGRIVDPEADRGVALC